VPSLTLAFPAETVRAGQGGHGQGHLLHQLAAPAAGLGWERAAAIGGSRTAAEGNPTAADASPLPERRLQRVGRRLGLQSD
jgi:hypothetical protein